ncbi:TPA: hypothetical protein OYE06_001200 [Staphylococcus aureus]|uniref:hypothetical protein n=1 Tax=Staphylococcus aureus TaxID=1280 RepID=UPI000A0FBC06|nr:hypothetical protein [Staphylococcus aureus]MBU7114139.1 hypothetical protein [Staphylococcus aureus]ORN42308.1 hypothetical protein B8A23_09615 [Staphylococcus aureus]BDV04816.1 hypothetical protein JP008_07750 [Staphylococcus aureus]HAR4358041.1 hypothetical protein [Staphylococcus aureus]HBC4232949.1 hypothetical protein [Staphylococcus aureus]
MNSFALRNCTKFDIFQTTKFYKGLTSTNLVGEISPTKKTVTLNNHEYKIFKCEQYKNKNNEIIVDGTPHSEYKEVTHFETYYCKDKNLLILNTAIGDAKTFLKYLEKNQEQNINLSKIDFQFKTITKQPGVLMDQIWFNTSDKHAKTKSFNGVEVNKNSEAQQAINDKKATYIKVQMDVASNNKTVARTIGFSKKSGVVLVQKNDADIDSSEKELQLLLDTYETYKNFN